MSRSAERSHGRLAGDLRPLRVRLQSGSIDHEQGVSKAGNPRLRTTMVELAWLWLRNQPASALSLWFHERVRRRMVELPTRASTHQVWPNIVTKLTFNILIFEATACTISVDLCCSCWPFFPRTLLSHGSAGRGEIVNG